MVLPGVQARDRGYSTQWVDPICLSRQRWRNKHTSENINELLQNLCGVDPAQVKLAGEALAQSTSALIIYGPMVAQGELARIQ